MDKMKDWLRELWQEMERRREQSGYEFAERIGKRGMCYRKDLFQLTEAAKHFNDYDAFDAGIDRYLDETETDGD